MPTSSTEFSDEDLVSYLEERLCEAESSRLEKALRDSPELRVRMSQFLGERTSSEAAPGAVWARNGLSCPDRTSWSAVLLGLVDDADLLRYATFHLETIGCRRCRANVEELQEAIQGDPERTKRQTRYFESSVGRLRDIQFD